MKSIVMLSVLIFAASSISGQSNALLDSFLDAEKADIGTSMLIVAQATGRLSSSATPADGYDWAAKQSFGRFMKKRKQTDPITLGVFYLALFQALNVKSNSMLDLFKVPRYAAMDAKYWGYVDPSRAYYTRHMLPYEVLTGITYIQEDIELNKLKIRSSESGSNKKGSGK